MASLLPNALSRTLPNGFRLVFVEEHSNPVLCLQLYVKTGSIYENRSQRGYSHFLEHLVFKSTTDFPDNSISRQVTALGGMLNAYTDYDTTCFYLLLPSENLLSGLHILSELAINASFNETDVEIEKGIILEEIKQYRNDPETDHIEWIQRSHFKQSPLKYPVLGSESAVMAASETKLKRFMADAYCPQNSYLVVCGDFQHAELTQAADQFFGNWSATSMPRNIIEDREPELPLGKYWFRKRQESEYLLSFILPELCEGHPLADALLVAMRYFAIGKSSRLYKRLVEESRLCSSVKVSSLTGLLSGVSVVMCTPLHKKHLPAIIKGFAEEFNALLSYGIPQTETNLVKKDIIHSWRFSFEGMENLANLVAVEESLGNLDRLHQYGDEIQSLSYSLIRQAIETYWKAEYLELFCEGETAIREIRPLWESVKQIELKKWPAVEIEVSPQSQNEDKAWPAKPACVSSDIREYAENYYHLVLANGMKVLYRWLPESSVSGFSLSTDISQICEDKLQAGSNYFASSLMLYATGLHSHKDLMKMGREHGFNIRVVHHLDSTAFRGKCLAGSLDKALALLAEILGQPRFDNEHLKLLKESALDSIRRDNAYPVSYAYQQWFRMLVGKNTNLYRSTGDPREIRRISARKLETWYEKWNLGRNFSLAIVSSQNPQEIAAWCESLFNFGTNSAVLTPEPFLEALPSTLVTQHRRTDQAIIHLGGFACPAINRDENAAFYILSQILGGDISSRFYDILREKHGLAYQTGFDFSSINQLGFWNAYAFCDKTNHNRCLDLMQEILDELRNNEISQEELHAAQNYLIGMNRFDLESASYSAASMSNLSALGYEPEYYLNRESRIKAVDTRILKSLARKYLNPENRYIHVLV